MMTSFVLFAFSISRFLERGERFIPESIEPSAQCLNPPRVHRIEPPRTLGAIDNQSRRLEHFQVLGDRGTAHVHPFGNLAHRTGAAAQTLEHPSTGWISQGVQDSVFVSHDLR